MWFGIKVNAKVVRKKAKANVIKAFCGYLIVSSFLLQLYFFRIDIFDKKIIKDTENAQVKVRADKHPTLRIKQDSYTLDLGQ